MITKASASDDIQDLSIQKACQEYTNSVKLTLTLINHQLDTALARRFNELEELAVKIAARTQFLEKNPTFLSVLKYERKDVKCEPILEFDDVKLTLKEHSKRILEKMDVVEVYHQKLLDLVISSGRESDPAKTTDEDEFKDCIDKHEDGVKLESLDTFNKITMQKGAFSDTSFASSTAIEPPKFQIFPDIPADVQRGKPQEDLHGKLIQQLEASDSLEGFIKLMDRKPRMKSKKTQHNLAEKYTGSLWFFPKSGKTPLARRTSAPKSVKHESLSASTCCNLLVTSSQPAPMTNQERTKRIKHGLARTRLRCYDLLDDIDGNDVKPIKSEYPRRDNIYPMKLHEAKSYLHRMMQENEKVWKKLLQPAAAKKQPAEAKKKSVRNLMEYLTAPQQKYLTHIPQSLIVMPVKIFYDNFPTKETPESQRGAVLITDLTKTMEASKTDGKALHRAAEACRSDPFPIQRKREMLDQLRGLKMRNDSIQKNIQKAIDVIETKMIDLLSSPTSAGSSEAFNAMEEEITNVLKMMNDSEKVEAEKDHVEVSPTVKRGNDVKKTVIFNLPPEGGDQTVAKEEEVKTEDAKLKPEENVKKKEDPKPAKDEKILKVIKEVTKSLENVKKKEDAKPVKDEKILKVIKEETKIVKSSNDGDKTFRKKEEKPREEKKQSKSDYEKITIKKRECSTEPKPKTTKPHQEEGKKTANIEEGERLLGQVDSVIRKIDSIYTKFYDDSKTRVPTKQDARGADVIKVLKQVAEPPPLLVHWKELQGSVCVFQQAHAYHQAKMYHVSRLELPQVDENVETEDEYLESEQCIVTHEGEVQTMEVVEMTPKCVTFAPEDKRHDYTLKAFYTFFFSSIFIALNFDYAA